MRQAVRSQFTAQRAPWALHRRPFSTSYTRSGYADTLRNLRIGSHTRVIFQGFTGKQATANARDSLAWGTKIVGGVTPGRSGEQHLGLPVLPTVRQAVEQLKPDATAIYVAAHQAAAAIEEAIEAEVPLVVAVAEHIPLHDMLRIHSILKTQSKSRLVGPNSPGIISAVGKCRIGFQPLPCFSPGRVAIIAKSGTLSYETVASTTRAGLGQSLCIGIGGDILPGTDFCEALAAVEHDPDTDAIALIGEIGGIAEMEAASWIREYRSRAVSPKPIVGLIAGIHEVPGRVMGHAGAFTALDEPDAKAKITALVNAGVTMVHHPSDIGEVLREKLQGGSSSRQGILSGLGFGSQRRQMSTVSRRHRTSAQRAVPQQKRHLYLSTAQSVGLLIETDRTIRSGSPAATANSQYLVGVGIDRSSRMPCIIAGHPLDVLSEGHLKRFPFDFQRGPVDIPAEQIASHLGLRNQQTAIDSLSRIIKSLVTIFYEKEAFLLISHLMETDKSLTVVSARFGFDDAAFRIAGRHQQLHEMRDAAAEDPSELEAEQSGIVYLKLAGDDATVGTLVNGAGLAMNTVDALARLGGRAANFLDTGGKATSETVKKSFEVILRDERVRVVFVNIFGGLTLGDMIARGIILAFEELSLTVPVVVRIRGTNEREGQQLIARSGLPLFAFDSFDEAAAKAIELSRR
ncbi:succinyl-CoA synthetase-like protein [Echria macrotheca]|uniref:Succinyl-CoA synthetase-like protein n=1 Tax=Echria macrotheca TaxID=438768 RepID=A0AAJ0BKG5_9PEZI|nr:succinyl-CoA synthetase-like protein [Echria macrotheca]